MTSFLAVVAALLAAAPGDPSARRGVLRAERPVPGRYLVLLESGDPATRSSALASRHGGAARHVFRHAVRGFSARLSAEAAAALAAEPGVLLVEEDAEVTAAALQTPAPWALDRLDQRALPLDGGFSFGSSGAGVHGYVVDTGVRVTHAEFGGRADEAFSAIDDGGGAADCNGHGTAVAALLGGATYGVAKGVTLRAVRALGCDGKGTISDVIAALDWIASDARGPAVAVLSLTADASPTLDAALEGLVAGGVVAAVAAGNQGGDACAISPARAPSALTVGGSTSIDTVALFSNRGSCIDLFAPGQGVLSAWHTGDLATAVSSGTSMAAPLVAGAAALLLEASPAALPAEIADALTANATSGALAGLGGSPDRLLYAGPAAGSTPLCAISWPSDGFSFRRATRVRVTASDDDGVARVNLYASGRRVASDGAAPWEMIWDARFTPKGVHTLVAEAVDAAGNVTVSAPVSVILK